MAILGIILPGVLYAFTTGSRTRASAEAQTTAAFLALDRIAELEALETIETGEVEGEFEAGARYRWRTQVLPTEVEGLYDVTVWIVYLDAGQERQFALRTYLADRALAPAQGPGGAAPSGGGGR